MITSLALIDQFKSYLADGDGYIWGKAGVLWTAAMQKAATREQTVKYGAQWIGHMVEDCSGAFTRAFKALGGEMYHGSNTMYLRWCTSKGKLSGGTRTDGKELKPGTAVFVWNKEDQKYSHVGLYIGNGEVIEAAGTRQGVIQGKVTNPKWTNWGELKGVDYSGDQPEPTPEPTPQPTHPTLRKGDKGDQVRYMQLLLQNKGYSLGKCGIDGSFGLATETAVKAFQRDSGLNPDGICGPLTWAALESGTPTPEPEPEPTPTPDTRYTATIPNLTISEAEALKLQFPQAEIREE